jgi:hypothetical protein
VEPWPCARAGAGPRKGEETPWMDREGAPCVLRGEEKVAGGCGKCRGGNAKMAKCKEGAPLFIEEALGLGFQLGQMGWVGLGPKRQTGPR